jgi:hypothetical protein
MEGPMIKKVGGSHSNQNVNPSREELAGAEDTGRFAPRVIMNSARQPARREFKAKMGGSGSSTGKTTRIGQRILLAKPRS